MKYYIKMECFEANTPGSYLDSPSGDPGFETKKEAIEYMFNLVQEEVDYLQEECSDDLRSFNYVIDDRAVTVNCYLLEDEHDDTGETQIVTRYFIEERG